MTESGLARIVKLRRMMTDARLDAIIVLDRMNTFYLSGFRCTYSILIVDRDRAFFVTDSRYGEAAERQLSGFDVRIQPAVNARKFLRGLLREGKYKTAGYEGTISVDEFETLKRWTRGTRLVKAGHLIHRLRRIKDEAEIKSIRKAVRLADRIMKRIAEEAVPGVREIDLSRRIRVLAEEFGGEKESFENIVASGPNSSRPHHHPGTRKLTPGDPLTIDLGVVVEGYCSDLTRTFSLGQPSEQFRRLYSVCLKANRRAIENLRPGMNGREVDAIARDVITDAGYGQLFGHGLGHGVGLEIHEPPRLSPAADDYLLEPGNIVTIEPGIYMPGEGGVRIEDYVLITESGAEVLSKSPRSLSILPV